MFQSGKSIVGLDIGSAAVKAVELTRSGKGLALTGVAHVEINGENPEDVAKAVGDLLREARFGTKRIVSAVSGKMVIIRYLSMAPMSDEELRNAILFEAEKYIPFTLDECILDCQRLEPTNEGSGGSQGNINVVLVAVKRTHLDEHLASLQGTGLTPEVIDVDAFAIGNAYDLMKDSAVEGENSEGTTAFIDVGAAKTSVNIVRGGLSLFTREIYLGGRDFTTAIARRMNIDETEAEILKRSPGEHLDAVKDAVFPTIDDLGNELQLSFDYFETQYNSGIDRIMLSGGSSRFSFFREAFEKIFEKPTSIFNPFEGLAVNDDMDQDMLSNSGPQMAVAVGLASRIRKV